MHPKKHNYFKFLDWNLNTTKHELYLNYEIEKVGVVTEVLAFPSFVLPNNKEQLSEINSACEIIHLMCGVSYYKAGLANEIIFKNDIPSNSIKHFYEKTWKNGLAELAFENQVSLEIGHTNTNKFDNNSNIIKSNALTTSINSPIKSLVAMGGGKDSLVTIEELKQQGNEITLFMVGNSSLIKQVSKFTKLPLIQVRRKIDSKLIEYNKTSDGFNGHIPITAINSCVGVLSALLFDFQEVVFSNERSADSANTVNEKGELVNHQYSKSYEFECDLSAIISSEITNRVKYYSQQRAFSELAILEKFSQYPHYFNVFSSCNRNFHIDGSQNKNSLWCCDCPKCRFVFLGLAPFLIKQQLLEIFGHNLLNDLTQKQGFEELLGIKGFKPFECVGEIQESQLAYNLIKSKVEWENDIVIDALKNNVPETTINQEHNIMRPTNI